LLRRWGKEKKPQLLSRIEQLDKQGQLALPGVPGALTEA
ncbi:Rha family transcriptional regulator, partial [Klebsiella pneumoniae]|nr:Rha family transcriptional regulator [Klebsiella pneumoniae]